MALFVGRHVNKIDKKGRVSVPGPFRVALQAHGMMSIFVYPRFRQNTLEACDEAFMARLSRSLDDLDMFSDEQDDLASVILANACQLSFDPEGRIMLPKNLADYAGLGTEAVFVGQGSRFHIWEKSAFDAFSSMTFDRAKARGATLKLRQEAEGDDR